MQNSNQAGFGLSPQQSDLWSAQQESQTAFYAQCTLLIEGKLERSVLEEAVRKVVMRHEILRTLFHRRMGMKLPLQIIDDAVLPVLEDIDLSAAPEREQQIAIEKVLREQRPSPGNFSDNTPFRSALVKLSSNKHLFCLSLPSLCADALSLRNLA